MNTNFYKNLASNTPFQFDRFYSNKWSMDKNAQYDRIQIGRYVFVEYDDYEGKEYIKIKPEIYTEPDGTSILEYYFLDEDGNKASKAWGQIQYELLEGKKSNVKFQGNILIGDIYYNVDDEAYYEVCEQELNGNLGSKYFSDLVFNKVEESSILLHNTNKDAPYNYDSTIWQKVYKNGKEQYEQIATVDTPVLEIGLSEKALTPSSLPEVKIGFNAEKDNNYYELSLPASWDFQVAEGIEGYSDESDENGKKLDIYYNKKGLNNISFIPFSSGWDDETDYYNRLEENQMIEIKQVDDIFECYKIADEIKGVKKEDIKEEDIISYDNVDYSKIKFLGENEYLWENIIDLITVENPKETFYYWGETRFIDVDDILNNEINADNIINYTFFKKDNSDNLVPFKFNSNDNSNRIIELREALEAGNVIQAITYAEVKVGDKYNKNITYYNKDYKEINIVIQNESSPYWEKKDENSSYYGYYLAGSYILNNTYDPDLKYYIKDENEEYQLVIFENDWEPYNYYEEITSDYEKYPYEIYNNKYYILSMDDEKVEGKKYYKKLIHSKDIKTINKISVEATDRKEEVEGNDTQELSVKLPAVGNAIAEVYDILYGKNRESFIYSSIEKIESMYNDGKPLYNTDKKTVIGLINFIYDTIGRMKIKDLPDELNADTIKDSDLINTLFKKDDKYYLVIKRPGAEEVSDDFVNTTLPKGRMKGDVDGDGAVTSADCDLVLAHTKGTLITDEIALWCADTNGDGSVEMTDYLQINSYINNIGSALTETPLMADYYGNWTWVKIDDTSGYFYKDIDIEGMTKNSKAVLHTSAYEDCFIGVECMENAIRVKAERLPLEDIDCILDWRPKWIYKAELFNEKSLYHLIAEMQHLVSGSYEGIFEALDKELNIVGDNYVNVKNVEENGRFYYELKHKKNFDQTKNEQSNNFYLNMSLDEYNNIVFYFTSYTVDEAGHIVNNPKLTRFEIPRAYAEGNDITETAPIGSFWYDTSDLS